MIMAEETKHYYRPNTVEAALSHLSSSRPLLLAGGTDIYPSLQGKLPKGPILDLSSIASMRAIKKVKDRLLIGALATWTDILRSDLPPGFRALQQAASEVGSTQIQNRGTIAGNLCNASPAADGVPPLLVLDATLVLASERGQRRLPLEHFILGNRKTALASDELVLAIDVPFQSANGASAFMKLGARRYLVISIAMVATRLVRDESGTITECSVSVGACSAVAKRMREVEQKLVGMTLVDVAAGRLQIDPAQFVGLEPIDDIRATSDYRREAVGELIVRCLSQTANELKQ